MRFNLEFYRQPDDFGRDGASEKIMQIRYQHYEEKRKAKIRTISDSVKENLLDQFRQRYENVGSTTSLHKSPSPQRAQTQPPSGAPDIPLREPYGAESFVKK